jgi:hypothetical protein
MYGDASNVTGRVTLDGGFHSFLSNSTIGDNGATPVYRADSLEDGDHQLMGELIVDELNGVSDL